MSLDAQTVSAGLKVYSADVEIACLFVVPDAELLISFRRVAPLQRMDRCTTPVYRWLHMRQSSLLPVRARFKRCQRLHTRGRRQSDQSRRGALGCGLEKEWLVPSAHLKRALSSPPSISLLDPRAIPLRGVHNRPDTHGLKPERPWQLQTFQRRFLAVPLGQPCVQLHRILGWRWRCSRGPQGTDLGHLLPAVIRQT